MQTRDFVLKAHKSTVMQIEYESRCTSSEAFTIISHLHFRRSLHLTPTKGSLQRGAVHKKLQYAKAFPNQQTRAESP